MGRSLSQGARGLRNGLKFVIEPPEVDNFCLIALISCVLLNIWRASCSDSSEL